ncbi:MAG: hypothetical protein ACTSPK_00005, partial [Candidatus Heimdallarchaeota archaeon]
KVDQWNNKEAFRQNIQKQTNWTSGQVEWANRFLLKHKFIDSSADGSKPITFNRELVKKL